jgi:dTDP-4-amino-4,6-dideoxygalactose transaminase
MGPVHALLEVCNHAQPAVPLVEDASQSTGAALDGRKAGTWGRAGVFSLVSGKNLQTFGGGLCASGDAQVAARIQALYEASVPAREDATRAAVRAGMMKWSLATRTGFVGGVFAPFLALSEAAPSRFAAMFHEERRPFDASAATRRLSDLQGTLGCLELAEVDSRNATRLRNALRLHECLADLPGIQLQRFNPAADNTFNAVAARVADAGQLAKRLLRRGIDSRTDYMQWYGPKAFSEGVLYLPNHPGLGRRDVDRVARAVRQCLKDAAAVAPA